MKDIRKLKVYETSGYYSKDTPVVILRGKWLRLYGFEIGSKINVTCKAGLLTIRLNEKEAPDQ